MVYKICLQTIILQQYVIANKRYPTNSFSRSLQKMDEISLTVCKYPCMNYINDPNNGYKINFRNLIGKKEIWILRMELWVLPGECFNSFFFQENNVFNLEKKFCD